MFITFQVQKQNIEASYALELGVKTFAFLPTHGHLCYEVRTRVLCRFAPTLFALQLIGDIIFFASFTSYGSVSFMGMRRRGSRDGRLGLTASAQLFLPISRSPCKTKRPVLSSLQLYHPPLRAMKPNEREKWLYGDGMFD